MLEERKRFCDADKFIVSYICYREFKELFICGCQNRRHNGRTDKIVSLRNSCKRKPAGFVEFGARTPYSLNLSFRKIQRRDILCPDGIDAKFYFLISYVSQRMIYV